MMSNPMERDPAPAVTKMYAGRPLPRNIRRALENNDELRLELAIDMATEKGWTVDELTEAFNWYTLWHNAKVKSAERDALADEEYTEN